MSYEDEYKLFGIDENMRDKFMELEKEFNCSIIKPTYNIQTIHINPSSIKKENKNA